MSHLKLVVTNTHPNRSPVSADTQRPVPTPEFLARQVLALSLGEQSIGAALAEWAAPLRYERPNCGRRLSELSDALRLVGIWLIHPDIDDPMPVHGMVVHPAMLVKRHKEFKRVLEKLDGLILMPQEV